MRQTRFASFTEAVTSTIIGFILSMFILAAVSWLWALDIDLTDNFLITSLFTVASVVRSYLVRRAFNWYHHRDG